MSATATVERVTMGRTGQRRSIDAMATGLVIGALVGAAGLGLGLGRDTRLPSFDGIEPAAILADGGHSHMPSLEPAQSDAFVAAARTGAARTAPDPFLAATERNEAVPPFVPVHPTT